MAQLEKRVIQAAPCRTFEELAQRLLGDTHPAAVAWLAADLRRHGAAPERLRLGERQRLSPTHARVQVEGGGQSVQYTLVWGSQAGVWGWEPEDLRPRIIGEDGKPEGYRHRPQRRLSDRE